MKKPEAITELILLGWSWSNEYMFEPDSEGNFSTLNESDYYTVYIHDQFENVSIYDDSLVDEGIRIAPGAGDSYPYGYCFSIADYRGPNTKVRFYKTKTGLIRGVAKLMQEGRDAG